jgi:hypothetical protein
MASGASDARLQQQEQLLPSWRFMTSYEPLHCRQEFATVHFSDMVYGNRTLAELQKKIAHELFI